MHPFGLSLETLRLEQGHLDFHQLVDGIGDYGIFMLDPDGIVLTWNSGAERMQGYKRNEVIGLSASTFYRPDDVTAGKAALELAVARTEGRFEAEGWCQRKDGSCFWASSALTTLYDDRGGIRGFGKVTRDLTERRAAETQYRLLVESASDYAIIMLDATGIVRSWNAGAQAIIGYTSAEIINRSFEAFYDAADRCRKHPQYELASAAEHGRCEDEGWRLRKDGSKFWANVVITALRGEQGELIGFSKVTRDLSERRRAEEQLRASEERFRLMVQSVKDYAIVMMLDADGTVQSWNAGAEPIDGWTAEEIIGQSFERFYPREVAMLEAAELRVAADQGTFEDYSWRVRKDGTRFWANVVVKALRDDVGTLRGFSMVTRDVTERKHAEAELRKAYEELESFSYSVSHDLRAPLRSMDGFSGELCELYADKLDARGKDYLGRIRLSAQRMARLIDDLLNLSRLGRAKLDLGPVDMTEISRKIVGDLQRAEPDRNVEVMISPGLAVHADANLMRVVLENLIGNAWKYTSRHAAARIEVGVERSFGKAVYFVRDDGAGFDMTYSEKLFGAFQRLHAVDQFPGTGIGLATVKRIIHRHGGDVSASGEIEHGSTFNFTLGEA